MQQSICVLPVAPLRGEPSHKSEMVTQLLFGERVEVLECSGVWFRVRSLEDAYEGWLDERGLAPFDPISEVPVPCRQPKLYVRLEQVESGWVVHVPAGCFLPLSAMKHQPFRWGTHTFRLLDEPVAPAEDVFSAACLFLGAPYLWGGKTMMGIDCSALVQLACRLNGLTVPRDGSQQSTLGTPVSFEESRCGDLAFFSNAERRISHVGIVGPDHTLVHASGNVRLDVLTAQGIYRRDRDKITHNLAFIKRIRP